MTSSSTRWEETERPCSLCGMRTRHKITVIEDTGFGTEGHRKKKIYECIQCGKMTSETV